MINILFFARLREEAGQESLHVEKAGCTIKELKEWLDKEYRLSGLNRTMTAVNEEFTTDDTKVTEGDTIAFIPPVSGG
ncbi:molybdopterin converting factor subunit 1 [Salibacterium halotolerans]|uniref:Molybdopterin synthase sulfur carrier subunit n=1 Tax=Salibacterium halotolerans TaxID=1884432 RepID=A0A1I5LKJ0_9BACI|nr:molybdopterin converting factor subunit 1 [Salibacterium halotolerans]SFO97657.1 molybdopterin synthase sulfur carrier subunit [Salibacterium halotolerans]